MWTQNNILCSSGRIQNANGWRRYGLVRCGDTERYRNIAHYAQYTGYSNLCIRCLRNGIDVERCAYKAVTGAVGSRQHIQSAYLFPIVVDSQLEFIFGRVGHYLILLAFMYLKVSVYVFQDSRVSGFICDGQMQGGSGSVGQVWCINAEGFFFSVHPQLRVRLQNCRVRIASRY